jgi:hypothetical protein
MLKLLAFKQLCPLLKPQPESRTLQKKLDKSHHHQKKIFRILFFYKTQKMMKKKSSKYKNIESKKKLQKKINKIRSRKKINKTPTKTKKLAARGGSPQPHSSINRAEKISNLDDVHNSL